MSVNKGAQIRYTILDKCFSNPGVNYTKTKLLDTLNEQLTDLGYDGIALRQMQYDIKFMESEAGFNIELAQDLKDGRKRIFRYADPKFSLADHPLNQSDQEQLKTTLSILSRYRYRDDFEWLDELIPRIEQAFEFAHDDHNGLISYQSNRDYVGQSWVGELYNYLLQKKVLEINYKSFQQAEAEERIIHPYHLKQFNNRWFLFGHQVSENGYSGITTLALDRIISIKPIELQFIETTIDWSDYFDDMIGVSKNIEEPVLITLRFRESRIKYIDTKPIHGATQRKVASDPTGLTRTIKVMPNRELYQLLLSFGEDVTVISPELVKKEMKEKIDKMQENY